MPYGRRLDADAISNAINQYESGVSAGDVCAQFGVSVRTLYRWCERQGRGRPRLEERIAMLEAENQALKCELEILRSALNKTKRPAPANQSKREAQFGD